MAKDAMATGRPVNGEVHFGPNNSDHLVTTVLLDNDHTISTSFDITERKRMESEMRIMMERL